MHSQDENLDLREPVLDLPGGLQTVEAGHSDIHHNDVGA
jgi:hypothetical protein